MVADYFRISLYMSQSFARNIFSVVYFSIGVKHECRVNSSYNYEQRATL